MNAGPVHWFLWRVQFCPLLSATTCPLSRAMALLPFSALPSADALLWSLVIFFFMNRSDHKGSVFQSRELAWPRAEIWVVLGKSCPWVSVGVPYLVWR